MAQGQVQAGLAALVLEVTVAGDDVVDHRQGIGIAISAGGDHQKVVLANGRRIGAWTYEGAVDDLIANSRIVEVVRKGIVRIVGGIIHPDPS